MASATDAASIVVRKRHQRRPNRRNYTPPEIAERYGVANNKVIHWIESGQLAALNLATSPSGRPRYSITPEALTAFEEARRVRPAGEPAEPPARRPTRSGKTYF